MTLKPLFGDRTNGVAGSVVDAITIFATVVGTGLGMGAVQINGLQLHLVRDVRNPLHRGADRRGRPGLPADRERAVRHARPVPLSVLSVVLIISSFVTSADSATFVLGTISEGGDLDPHRRTKVIWGLLSVLGAVLLMVGGWDRGDRDDERS